MSTRAARIEELFHAALELEDVERAAFLTSSCAGDTDLRCEVEGLLEVDAGPDDRLDAAVPEVLSLAEPEGSLLVGRKLGPYELQRRIASGGMASVYAASQTNPGRTVAVKVLRAELASEDLRRRFRVESSFLARLEHPGIAHVYGADVELLDGVPVPYIAMELVPDALPITVHAERKGLSLKQRVELFVEICDAVRHGHQRGVIHRDIKPANVLVGAEGRPKLIDFGVARAVDPESATHRTEAGVFLGTVQYMSPEQCVDARDLDVRSDVYSLGVVLYELLCGRLPYDLDSAPLPQAARIVQERPPRRPSTVARALRGDIETILLKALEKDRTRRYQSAAELAEDLRRFLRREPIAARPPSLPYRLALYAGRNKLFAGALAAIVVVSMGAFVVSVKFALSEKQAREREERSSYLANIAAASASLRVFDAAGARRRLERVPAERRGWEWAHLWGELDLAQTTWKGPLARCDDIMWDGDRIVSLWWNVADEWRISVFDVSSGAEVALSPLAAHKVGKLALTADGRVVFGHDRLSVWDPVTGAVRELPDVHAAPVRGIGRLPDGRLVSAGADGSVHAWDVETGASTTLLASGPPWHSLAVSSAGDRVAVGGEDGSIHVLAPAAPDVHVSFPAHARTVNAVAFDASGTRLASGDMDGNVHVWDLASERIATAQRTELRRLVGHESEVQDLAFLHGEALLASASNDGTVRIWDVASGKPVNVLYGHENWVTCLDLDAKREHVVTGAYDGTMRIWDPLEEPGGYELVERGGIVRSLAHAPDGTRLISGSRGGRLKLIDTATRETLREWDGPGGRIWSVSVDAESELVAAGADAEDVLVWDLASGELVHRLTRHERAVSSVVFARDTRFLASGSWDGTIQFHAGAGLQPAGQVSIDSEVIQIDVTPRADKLVVAARFGRVWLFDIAERKLHWMVELGLRIHSVRFAPDTHSLAVGTGEFDGTGLGVVLLDTGSGAELRRMLGHTDVVYDAAFTPDGKRLASASADGTVRLWDPETGDEVLALRGHESWVWCVDVAPDGRSIASGGGNYAETGVGIRIWEAPDGRR